MSRVKKHKPKKAMERTAPKKKRISKQMIWTLIIGGLMVASVFGIMFSSYNSAEEQTTFGDYTFERTNTGWVTVINGQRAEFSYLPSDLEGFNISSDVTDRLVQARVVYLVFNPNSENVQKLELMRFQLGNSFQQVFQKYVLPGITEENEQYNQTLVDCANATLALPVVNIVEANQTDAYLDGNCIVLEATEFSTLALKDKILYAMLDIE